MHRPEDVKYLYLKKTISDEYGVYRMMDSLQGFLLLAFKLEEDAITCGTKLGRMLNLTFRKGGPRIVSSERGCDRVETNSEVEQ